MAPGRPPGTTGALALFASVSLVGVAPSMDLLASPLRISDARLLGIAPRSHDVAKGVPERSVPSDPLDGLPWRSYARTYPSNLIEPMKGCETVRLDAVESVHEASDVEIGIEPPGPLGRGARARGAVSSASIDTAGSAFDESQGGHP